MCLFFFVPLSSLLMNPQNTFEILLLLARPAAGKSEIIHYLKHTNDAVRRQRFHVGSVDVVDDFPMLWTWFEEDHILSELGQPRLHTSESGYFLNSALWNVLIRRICQEYAKRLRDAPDYHAHTTTLIEFSRGSQHGGFTAAFEHLSAEVVSRASILYVDVPYQESLRKNRRRFNPDRPDSILEHSLSDDKMERLYRESDWDSLRANDSQFISIQGRRVPYVVFENQDDVTTRGGEELGARLEGALERLWRLREYTLKNP